MKTVEKLYMEHNFSVLPDITLAQYIAMPLLKVNSGNTLRNNSNDTGKADTEDLALFVWFFRS